MTLPAIRCIRQAFPQEEIYLLVKQWVAEVFQNDPNLDHIIEYKREFEGVRGKIVGSRELKKYGFRMAILLQNAFDAAALAYLAGVPDRAGYDRDGRGFLLTRAIPVDDSVKRLHHSLYYLNLLRQMGVPVTYRNPWIYLDIQERLHARKRLEGLKRPVVLISPGATYGSAKRWPIKHFIRLIQLLREEFDCSVVITGASQEVTLAREMAEGQDGVLNLAGRTSLRQLMGLLAESDLVIANDSGPMHLAYAVGTPLIALFGSTSVELTGPPGYYNPEEAGFKEDSEFSVRCRVLTGRMDCSPCFERECRKGSPLCLERIMPEEVVEVARELVPSKRAVFFDRDGTLCEDAHYLNSVSQLRPFDDLESLRELKEEGFLLIGVSNQSGIARGIVEREVNEEINRVFIDRYGFDGFYYCPHHPDSHCACRKPSPGMLLRARAEFGVDLKASFVVGDRDTDMLLARAVGAKAIMVSTGTQKSSTHADRVVRGLKEAVDEILRMK